MSKTVKAGELVYDYANARLGRPILSHPVGRVVSVDEAAGTLVVEWESGPSRWERTTERLADFRAVSSR